eukprot:2172622-Alexandrium_andersonii.AAC.1
MGQDVWLKHFREVGACPMAIRAPGPPRLINGPLWGPSPWQRARRLPRRCRPTSLWTLRRAPLLGASWG